MIIVIVYIQILLLSTYNLEFIYNINRNNYHGERDESFRS